MISLTCQQRIAQVLGLSLLVPCAIGSGSGSGSDAPSTCSDGTSLMSVVPEGSDTKPKWHKTAKSKRWEARRLEIEEALAKHPDYIKIRGKHPWVRVDIAGIYKVEKSPNARPERVISYVRQPDEDVKIVRDRVHKGYRYQWVMEIFYPKEMIESDFAKKKSCTRAGIRLYCGTPSFETVPKCTLIDAVKEGTIWEDRKGNHVPLQVKQISKKRANSVLQSPEKQKQRAKKQAKRKQLLSSTRILQIQCEEHPGFDGKYCFNDDPTCIYNTYVCEKKTGNTELTYLDGTWKLKYQDKEVPCVETTDASLASLEYPKILINGKEIHSAKPEWTYYNEDSVPGDSSVVVDNASASSEERGAIELPEANFDYPEDGL